MPFIPGTPESLLARSDSKNPASTCRGVTSNGAPCRRSLAKSAQSSPMPSPRKGHGLSLSPAITPDAYCWQHKEQHGMSAPATPSGRHHTLQERTSVDTLVERLNLLEVEQKNEKKHKRKPVQQEQEKPQRIQRTQPSERRKPRPQKQSNLSLFCCIGDADEKKYAPRPVKSNQEGRTSSKLPSNTQTLRPPIHRDPLSITGEFLSLIPHTATPQTSALLLAELAKPVSVNDEEGYIYMFWLTPEDLPSEPALKAAPSLLAPPSQPRGQGGRRTSDVISSFATTVPNTTDKKTILLKIGRAANVQKRLNEWTRQCGYNVSLIRYYPYHPSTSAQEAQPRKVPNVHKVERLIHIELNAKRLQGKGKCDACGKEHREWFEVEAGREAVRAVDEVIRRWSDWAEGSAGR